MYFEYRGQRYSPGYRGDHCWPTGPSSPVCEASAGWVGFNVAYTIVIDRGGEITPIMMAENEPLSWSVGVSSVATTTRDLEIREEVYSRDGSLTHILDMEPGVYYLVIAGRWPDDRRMSYGFRIRINATTTPTATLTAVPAVTPTAMAFAYPPTPECACPAPPTTARQSAVDAIMSLLGEAGANVVIGQTAGLPVTAKDMDELLDKSTLVVVGQVADTEPTIREIPGLLSDGVSPDPDYSSYARVYDIEIESVLKGNAGQTLQVVEFIGSKSTLGRGLAVALNANANLPLKSGGRYVLFLRAHRLNGLWIGTAHPFRFAIDSGMARVETPYGGLAARFPDTSLNEFLAAAETKAANQ